MAGCDVVAKYNSADVHMIPALKTGHLEIRSNSIVREIVVSGENRVTGVRYLDRTLTYPHFFPELWDVRTRIGERAS